MSAFTITFTTTVTISDERVQDLLINAVETISAYWCSDITQLHEGDIYDISKPDWKWEVTEDQGDVADVYVITRDDVSAGIDLMQKIVPHQFNNWINDNEDAITADCFFQCVVLKDVIYG